MRSIPCYFTPQEVGRPVGRSVSRTNRYPCLPSPREPNLQFLPAFLLSCLPSPWTDQTCRASHLSRPSSSLTEVKLSRVKSSHVKLSQVKSSQIAYIHLCCRAYFNLSLKPFLGCLPAYLLTCLLTNPRKTSLGEHPVDFSHVRQVRPGQAGRGRAARISYSTYACLTYESPEVRCLKLKVKGARYSLVQGMRHDLTRVTETGDASKTVGQ